MKAEGWLACLILPVAHVRQLRPVLRSLSATLACSAASPIRLRFAPRLHLYRDQLLHGPGRGIEVHAAAFLRRREIVLDDSLLRSKAELRRILVHELFHFAWLRLGNPRRHAFELLLRQEGADRRGELGWSAESRLTSLKRVDLTGRTRRWREYVCESFCDTAAWLYAGLQQHEEFTLPLRHRTRRRRWFRQQIEPFAVKL